MPKLRRLRDNHPTVKKLERVFALMQELHLEITVGRYGTVTVIDRELDQSIYPDQSFDMQDAESDVAYPDFPPTFEYKLTYEDDSEDRTREVVDS